MTQQNDLGAIQVSGQEMALADCPFCGEQPVFLAITENDNFVRCYEVRCDNCGIEICEEYKNLTIERWNDRHAPTGPDIRAALEAAKVFADDEFSYASDLNRKNRIIRLCDLIDAALSPAGDTGREAVPTVWLGTPDPKALAARLRDPSLSAYKTLRHEAAALLESLASPQPAARIGREEIAREIQHSVSGEPRGGLLDAKFLRCADAILALTARDAGPDVAVTRANR